MPGLVPGIQPSRRVAASGWLDPGDKRRDDMGTSLGAEHYGAVGRGKLALDGCRELWSREIREFGRRFGIAWPPQPALLWHLRTPIRENAFLVQWAMDRAVATLLQET
jgi:hypothetical protein